MELLNLNFKEWKYFQDCSLKRVLINLPSKIVCGRVTLFQLKKYQLVYLINVRELPKYTLTSQQFWKLTNKNYFPLIYFFRKKWFKSMPKFSIIGDILFIKVCKVSLFFLLFLKGVHMNYVVLYKYTFFMLFPK